eukprot:NODE_13_length_42895_cov_0.518413.p15 type:complete len:250 gc:universal NODE_13_length_42895_cov_0.518413:4644-5393(+)
MTKGTSSRHSQRASSKISDKSRSHRPASEKDEIEFMKDRINVTKEKSLDSSRSTRRRLEESERMAALNMSNISDQNDKLTHIEHNMNIADLHTDKAINKTERLEQLNKNFITSAANPLKYYHNAKHNSRNKKHDAKEKELKGAEIQSPSSTLRDKREQIYNSSGDRNKSSSGRRGRQQLLDGEEHCPIEREIDENVEFMSGSISRLKQMALAVNEEVSSQNQRIKNISSASDSVQSKTVRTERKLKKFS